VNMHVEFTKNKRLRLNRLDTWWAVDWYRGSYHMNLTIH
jgi:hypothetical protein